MQRMQGGLREIVSAIVGNAVSLRSAAGQVNDTSSTISQSVGEQGGAIESTAAAVQELSVSISLVSQNAESARAIAQRTVEIASHGKQLVVTAANEINQIANSVRDTSSAMENLRNSSVAISDIANVIRDIADQTNLLALNAAIEAARAGEQGRGFAVVADEVRKLAEKTTSATNEIKVMIETIQRQSNDASNQMGSATKQVSSGVDLIHSLQAPLQELFDGAKGALVSLTELSSAAKEQSHTSTQIAQNIETIAQMSGRNTEAAGKSYETAQKVDQMASGLQQLIGRFRAS
jgi:methyl-accepting chemotaxis protein